MVALYDFTAGSEFDMKKLARGEVLTGLLGRATVKKTTCQLMHFHRCLKCLFRLLLFSLVLEKPASGWWLGRLTSGETGLFPSNYVQPHTLEGNAAAENPSDSPVAAHSVSENPLDVQIVWTVEAFDELMDQGFVVEPTHRGPGEKCVMGQWVEVHVTAMIWNGAEGRRLAFASTNGGAPMRLRLEREGSSCVATQGLRLGLLSLKIGDRATIT